MLCCIFIDNVELELLKLYALRFIIPEVYFVMRQSIVFVRREERKGIERMVVFICVFCQEILLYLFKVRKEIDVGLQSC